jgi:hypothetical protein
METTTRELLLLLKAMPTPASLPAPIPAVAVTPPPPVAAAAPPAATETRATAIAPPRPDATAPTAAEKINAAPPPPSPVAKPPSPDQHKPTPPSDTLDQVFDFGSSLPLSVKLIGAMTILLALSLAAYRWLLTHTPQTDPIEDNRPPRHPPYLGGAVRKAHQPPPAALSGRGRNPS